MDASSLSPTTLQPPPYEPFTPPAPDRAEAMAGPDVEKKPLAPENAFSPDDLEVAKALTGLRSGKEHKRSHRRALMGEAASPAQSTTTTTTSHTVTGSPAPRERPRPEPLLSLLTSQHPLIASTINNSLSAYSSSKTYSPRFRYGAEFVERNLASPVASTVSTAGRISGVETGVRWMLRRSTSNATENEDTSNKRRRIDPDAMDVERGPVARPREPSEGSESLPAYDDDRRSPVYEEYAVVPTTPQERQRQSTQPTMPHNWQTRLMISTSGLGVAMSDESLRSLKYCLSWLRWANTHLDGVLLSLQTVLQEWDRSQAAQHGDEEASALQSPPLSPSATQPPPRDAATIAKHLAALRAECVRTLKSALDVVSTYAGGALPENARHLVRRHLTSLPMRFQLASSQGGSQPGSAAGSRRPSVAMGDGDESSSHAAPTPEAVSGAQRVVVLAREGLDMMTQVSAVVDGTIVSAEAWCERLGRRPTGASNDGTPAEERSEEHATGFMLRPPPPPAAAPVQSTSSAQPPPQVAARDVRMDE